MNQQEFDKNLHKLYDAIHKSCNHCLPTSQKLAFAGNNFDFVIPVVLGYENRSALYQDDYR